MHTKILFRLANLPFTVDPAAVMPACLIGSYLFIEDPYRGAIAVDPDGVCAIPFENRSRGGMVYLPMFSPAHCAGLRCTIDYLIGFDEQIFCQIIHLSQVALAEMRFHNAPTLRDENSPILSYSFLLSAFHKCEYYKQLGTAVQLHILVGVGHILDFVIHHLHVRSTKHAISQRMSQPFGGD